jgi:O-antigen/teichoic acid export membrane protein
MFLQTAGGAASSVVSILTGIWTFRQTSLWLSPEEFGFWAFLWSLLGLISLSDMGFGFSIQRAVARARANDAREELGRSISSLILFRIVNGILLAVVGYFLAPWLVDSVHPSQKFEESFVATTRVFFLGLAILLPINLVADLLLGSGRLLLVSIVRITRTVIGAVALTVAIRTAQPMWFLCAVVHGFELIGHLAFLLVAGKELRGIHLSFRSVSWASFKELSTVSRYALVTRIAAIASGRVDHMVLAWNLAIPAVALYQVGRKAVEYYGILAFPFAETLRLHAMHDAARGDKEGLREKTILATRYFSVVALVMGCVFGTYIDVIVQFLGGMRPDITSAYVVGITMLAWRYVSIISQNSVRSLLWATDRQRILVIMLLVEATANVALSVALTRSMHNIAGVTLGSLIPATLLAIFFYFPVLRRETGLSWRALFNMVFWRPLYGCAPMLVVAAILRYLRGLRTFGGSDTWIVIAAEMGIVFGVGLIGTFYKCLEPEEQESLVRDARDFMKRLFAAGTA